MEQESWQTIVVLPAVYRGRCLTLLLRGKPRPSYIQTLCVEWTDIRVRFDVEENVSSATIEVGEPDAKELTKILSVVMSCAVTHSTRSWAINWTTSCVRWGMPPQRLQRRLIDTIERVSADEETSGTITLRGGQHRPYKNRAVEENEGNVGTFLQRQYGHATVKMTLDRLDLHLDNPSPAALVGSWKLVMRRLGVRVPANGKRRKTRRTRTRVTKSQSGC